MSELESIWCDCECGYVPPALCFADCDAEKSLRKILAEAQAILPAHVITSSTPKLRTPKRTTHHDQG